MKSFPNHTTSRRLFWVSVVVILLAIFVAACKPQPTDTPTPLPSVPPTEQLVEPTTTMRVEQADPLLDINPVPIQQVWGIEWRWTAWVETQPASQSIVPDSQNYHLVLNNDGTYLVKADCNMVSGSYQTDDINLTLNPGPMTLAQCDPESLSDQYLDLLAKVMSFGIRDGDLVLILKNNVGSMSFSNAGSYQPVPPSIPCVVGIDVSTVTVETLGLPYSYKANCVPETPYDASLPTGPIGLPDHVEINFGVGDFQDVSPTDPIIYIIPVSKYQDLWIQEGDDAVSNSISMLEGLLDIKLAPVPSKGLPILPFERVTGVADMQVQGAYLEITMGAGMRFVTRFVQTPNPVASDVPQMFYTFQGFSSDGAYLIAFFYPVTTEELSKANAITQEEQDFVSANSQAYMDAKITELNALEPSDWEPDLKQLDAVINTLKWGLGTGTPDITGVNWQWTSLAESNPASQSVVPDPQNYTLRFASDGSLSVKADCNTGASSYTINGNAITIQLGVLTKAACGSNSLSNQFLSLLEGVQSYSMEPGRLVLVSNDGGSRMTFSQGTPPESEPTKETTVVPTSQLTPEGTDAPPGEALVAVIIAPSEGQVDEQIIFDGSDSIPQDSIISYEWDFGDGSPVVDGAKVEHNFTKPGIYTVSLRITNRAGNAADAFLDITISE